MALKIYEIPFTEESIRPIRVPRRVFVKDVIDITLIGKRTLEYGQVFNENLLHLLEHFACKADPNNIEIPDPSSKLYKILEYPVVGQLWFNTSTQALHLWNGKSWIEVNGFESINGNSGFCYDGEYLPIPANIHGATHLIENCAMNVAPVYATEQIESFECTVSPFGKVTSKYTTVGGQEKSGYVYYIILCHGPCELPPPQVWLLDAVAPETCERYDEVTLAASILGDDTGHVLEWVQTGGYPVTLIEIDNLNYKFVANVPYADDLEFTFFIDKNTPIEQKKTVTVSQLGSVGYLTSKNYGLNKSIDFVAPSIDTTYGMLRIVPGPLDMTDGAELSISPSISVRGGYLTSIYINYDNYIDLISPSVNILGGTLKKVLITTDIDIDNGGSLSPSVNILGGTLKKVLITTDIDIDNGGSLSPSVNILGGTLE